MARILIWDILHCQSILVWITEAWAKHVGIGEAAKWGKLCICGLAQQ